MQDGEGKDAAPQPDSEAAQREAAHAEVTEARRVRHSWLMYGDSDSDY